MGSPFLPQYTMPAYDQTTMEDKNYLGLAQLYTVITSRITSNNPMAFENILDNCDDWDILDLIIEDILSRIDINYRIRPTDFFKSKMPHLLGSTLLHLTAEKNDIDMFNLFVKKGADFTVKNDDQSTVVHQMIRKSNFKKYFDSVIEEGMLEPDPFVDSVLLAHVAYRNSSNPYDANGVSHLSVACMTNNVEVVEFFLEHGVSVDEASNGRTHLHFAAKYCAVEVVELLLKRGANANVKDSKGMTVLRVLVEEKMKIWDKRARLMSMDFTQRVSTYTGLATLFEKNERMTRMVLDSRGTIVDEMGFYAACTMQDTSIVERYLNDNVVDVDRAIDTDSPFCPGYTALHFASHFNAETVKLLAKRGANMEARDAKGTTPFDICFRGFKVEDIHGILMLRSDWSDVTFLNGKTRLSSFVHAMREPNDFETYLRGNLTSMYTFVRLDSPFCAGYTPLHLAVALAETCPSNWSHRVIRLPRYHARIAACLSLGADVTAEDADGLTAVHRAFRLCENQVVSCLLRSQTRVFNPVDSDGLSHFHVACVVDCQDVIEKLIDSGVGVNIPIASRHKWYKENSYRESWIAGGSTPLHLVAEAGDVEMTELMIKHEANVFAKDADGSTAVERAVKARGHAEHRRIIDLLIEIGMNKVVNVTRDFDALVKLFRRVPEEFNVSYFVKHEKKSYGRILADEVMLQGVLKGMGITMLHLACYSNSREQIGEQLDKGADVNARVNDDSPFYPGYTPLHFAVAHSRKLMMDSCYVADGTARFLLDRGADVTIANCEQQTPVHQAFEWLSHEEELGHGFLDALLEAHKDFSVNPVDARGFSHFHLACFRNKASVVKEFLNKGVDVNQAVDHFKQTFGGYTPLHFAMIRPSKTIYSLLLKHGADANARDRLGNTPLHVAVKCGKWTDDQLFDSIFSAGADPNAKNLLHETVLEILLDTDEVTREAIASFQRHGARINIVNPITGEGGLTHAILTLHDDKAVFHEVTKFQDVMSTDESGSTAIHNIVTVDPLDYHNYSSFDALGKKGIPTEAEAIEILTRLNLDIDSKDANGMTALQIAVKNLNVKGTIGLLLNGANVNATIDETGKTSFSHIMEVMNSQQPRQTDNRGIQSVFDSKLSSAVLIFRVLATHVHKLLFAKLYVSEVNKNVYVEARNKFHMDNVEVYKAELEELKKRRIGSTSLTLRHFLSETGAVGAYPRATQPQRQEIEEFFSNSVRSLHKQFPAMTALLKLQYRKASARAELLSSAEEALNLVLGFELPVLCSDALMRYLTNRELENIIAAGNVL